MFGSVHEEKREKRLFALQKESSQFHFN